MNNLKNYAILSFISLSLSMSAIAGDAGIGMQNNSEKQLDSSNCETPKSCVNAFFSKYTPYSDPEELKEKYKKYADAVKKKSNYKNDWDVLVKVFIPAAIKKVDYSMLNFLIQNIPGTISYRAGSNTYSGSYKMEYKTQKYTSVHACDEIVTKTNDAILYDGMLLAQLQKICIPIYKASSQSQIANLLNQKRERQKDIRGEK